MSPFCPFSCRFKFSEGTTLLSRRNPIVTALEDNGNFMGKSRRFKVRTITIVF